MEMTIDQALQQGVTAHKEGKLQDAERLYRAILQSQPQHPDANHNLGVLAISVNRIEAALPFFRTAIEANPELEQFWLSYIDALIKAKQLENAKQTIQQAKEQGIDENKLDLYNIKLKFITQTQETQSIPPSKTQRSRNKRNKIGKNKPRKLSSNQAPGPDNPPERLLKELLVHYQNGEYDSAEKLALSITQMFSRHQFGWKVLGAVLRQTGRTYESLTPMQKCTKLAPYDPEAHNNLGVTQQDLGKLEEAKASYNRAIALKSDYAEAHFNLGNTLKEMSSLKEAEKSLRRAIALKPNFAEAHFNLGNTLKKQDELVAAEVVFKKAIALKPDYVEAHVNLGIIHNEFGKLEEAENNYNQAKALDPSFALTHYNLGNNLREQGRLEEAEDSYKQAIALKPGFIAAQSNILFLIASMRFDASRYRKEAKSFAETVAEQISSPYKTWSCSKSSKKIRVGFVSGDFKEHPVGIFLEGLLVQLQSSAIELYAYPTSDSSDCITDRLETLFHSWTSLLNKSDRDAARTIHQDGVHILIDLSGHTQGNRLAVFGWKPAPIQISWLGYFASTGLPAVDYILGDPFVAPKSESHHFVENVWRLPESYLCFTPPCEEIAIRNLPALINGHVTFGCFNKLLKMTDEVVSVRAEILRAVPHSKLFLKDFQLGLKSVREDIIARYAAHGITEDRLLLEGKSKREEYLACYHRVDIALSPFPYGGGTTSAEGLWMGVPVICKKGNHFLSHLGESMAHNSGLSDWIAVDNDDYIKKAIKFSSDLSMLNQLRQGLRGKLLKTPLFNSTRFANNFEHALFEIRESIEY